MSAAKHTPGPWAINLSPVRDSLCVTAADAWICGELDNGRGMSSEEAEANARLIAAAPQMLEALQELEAYLAGSMPTRAHALMEAAIAAATGEAR